MSVCILETIMETNSPQISSQRLLQKVQGWGIIGDRRTFSLPLSGT